MSIILDLLKAYVAGVLVFFAFGTLAAALLPWEDAKPIVDQYINMAMTVVKRGLFVKHRGNIKLVKTSVADFGAEVAKLGGSVHHWHDVDDRMASCYAATIGLAAAGENAKNVVFDARLAGIGGKWLQIKRQRLLQHDGMWKTFCHMSPGRHLADLSKAAAVIEGSASPRLADHVDDFTEKSQAGWNSRRSQAVQTIQLLMFAGAGFGLVYLGAKLAASTGGAVTGISLGAAPLVGLPQQVGRLRDRVAAALGVDSEELQEGVETCLLTLGSAAAGAALAISAYGKVLVWNLCGGPTSLVVSPCLNTVVGIGNQWMTGALVVSVVCIGLAAAPGLYQQRTGGEANE